MSDPPATLPVEFTSDAPADLADLNDDATVFDLHEAPAGSGTTETEILDCFKSNCRLAAQDCDELAQGLRGPIYPRLHERLKLCEGACRQMAHWREDGRWIPLGIYFASVQKRVGDWLRAREPSERFRVLAAVLRQGYAFAAELETAATGRLGAILPVVRAESVTAGRPVQVGGAPGGGLILPSGFVDQRKQTATPPKGQNAPSSAAVQ